MVELLGWVFDQEFGFEGLLVELALGVVIGLEVEREAPVITSARGIKTRLCAPGQRRTGPRLTVGGEI